jgi:hypothetical protein
MANCINDDNEVELDISTTYYSEKDPLFKQGKDEGPVDGLTLSSGDLNSPDEVKGVSEIKKCNPLEVDSLTHEEPVKCELKKPKDPPFFSWFFNTLLSFFRGEQKGTGDTVAKTILFSITTLFFMFMIYKNELYKISYLKSLCFTFIFLFKGLWVFFTIIFLLSLTQSVIFNFIPYFFRQFFKYLYLSINPLSDGDVYNRYESLKEWIIVPNLYLMGVVTGFILVTILIFVFILFILLPFIVVLGYFVGVFLSFMD